MQTITTTARRAAFIALTALIVVVGSERIYWYGAGFGWSSVLELAAFYTLPAAAGLWAMALTPARRLHQVILAGAAYAFVAEGVLTPVIYSDGPLPVTAAMFVGWHGMLAFVVLWYAFRRWIVEDRVRTVAIAATATGALWGLWAMAGAVGDVEASAGVLLDPTTFATYAGGVGAVLAVSHLGIGWVWPTGWRPSRGAGVVLGIALLVYFAVTVLPAVAWAPAKLAALLSGTGWLLRRSRVSDEPDEPTVLDALSGRSGTRSVAALVMLPVTASIVYGTVWALRATAVPTILFWAMVAAQVAVGAAGFTWAARRSLRREYTTGGLLR